MKINDNGIVRDMTAEEIAEIELLPAPEPSPEEQLRADIDFLAIMSGVEL